METLESKFTEIEDSFSYESTEFKAVLKLCVEKWKKESHSFDCDLMEINAREENGEITNEQANELEIKALAKAMLSKRRIYWIEYIYKTSKHIDGIIALSGIATLYYRA